MSKSFSVEFKVVCSECGSSLEVDETNNQVSVKPCPRCLNKAYGEGITEGSKPE